MDSKNYADQIMTLIAAGAARGIEPGQKGRNLPAFYLAKTGVPDSDRPAVCAEVARRLRGGPAPSLSR